jgi:hypothetical protein
MRKHQRSEERTAFQESGPYYPVTDSRADVAIVYGLNETFENRVARWREAGYRIHVMTGVAWGGYQDYVRGEWDGTQHYDDAQAAEGGFKLEHGISQGHDCFYMMPSESYARYLSEGLKRVVDAGALAVHLEEPEFWVRGGYSEGFKREWLAFYGEPWQDPASSPDARYRAAKLKQYLYTRTLASLFADLKAYAAEQGNEAFKCYVPTHSLINYAHWRIVSPESHMLEIPEFDGLIGQVWTGTSRTPNVYRGVPKQRTFEAGYCEYAACAAIVRGTDRRLWQLADPIEDNPAYCWDDYRENWECTVTGSLLVPASERFEIMPWPRRIFRREYPEVNLMNLALGPMLTSYMERLESAGEEGLLAETRRAYDLFMDFYDRKGTESRRETLGFANLADDSETLRLGDARATVNGFYKELATWDDQEDAQSIRDAIAAFLHNPTDRTIPIPDAYATELQVVFNALRDMHWPADTAWMRGETGIGLAISDTLMYQRGEPQPSDPDMSSLYGLAMPLVKNGTALQMVQVERLGDAGYLKDVDVLLITYEGQKPPSAAVHNELASWIEAGNVLILWGTGDAYDTVREWWNQEDADYGRPQNHLTELLIGERDPVPGTYTVGAGHLIVAPESPDELAHAPQGAEAVLDRVTTALELLDRSPSWGNHLVLRRGPYVVAAGMDESQDESLTLTGAFVNLFDPNLAIVRDPQIDPDTRWLLFDLSRRPDHPAVVAAAGRVEGEDYTTSSLSFNVEGMAETVCVIRAILPEKPIDVETDTESCDWTWDSGSHTIQVRFPSEPSGVQVTLRW